MLYFLSAQKEMRKTARIIGYWMVNMMTGMIWSLPVRYLLITAVLSNKLL